MQVMYAYLWVLSSFLHITSTVVVETSCLSSVVLGLINSKSLAFFRLRMPVTESLKKNLTQLLRQWPNPGRDWAIIREKTSRIFAREFESLLLAARDRVRHWLSNGCCCAGTDCPQQLTRPIAAVTSRWQELQRLNREHSLRRSPMVARRSLLGLSELPDTDAPMSHSSVTKIPLLWSAVSAVALGSLCLDTDTAALWSEVVSVCNRSPQHTARGGDQWAGGDMTVSDKDWQTHLPPSLLHLSFVCFSWERLSNVVPLSADNSCCRTTEPNLT